MFSVRFKYYATIITSKAIIHEEQVIIYEKLHIFMLSQNVFHQKLHTIHKPKVHK